MPAVERFSLRWLAYTLKVPVERVKALAENGDRFYRPYRQTRNGKTRLIDNPNDEMKFVQTQIRDQLLVVHPLSEIVHGCVKGRSAHTNASQHVRQPSTASVDIRNFYPSVTNAMVFRFFRAELRFGPKLADVLTQLTTRKGHLPTGAPTSDALANLIFSPIDQELARIAADLGLKVTRYVDNIDFSGVRSREAIPLTIDVLRQFEFAVRHRKVFNAGGGQAHIITGLNTNGRRPSLSRRHRNNVRAACHDLIRAHERGEPVVDRIKSLRGRLTHMRITNRQAADRLLDRLEASGISLTSRNGSRCET